MHPPGCNGLPADDATKRVVARRWPWLSLLRAYECPQCRADIARRSVKVRQLRSGLRMRRIFGFLAGVVVGQWLVFGSTLSPADLHSRAAAAYERRDYVEALR